VGRETRQKTTQISDWGGTPSLPPAGGLVQVAVALVKHPTPVPLPWRDVDELQWLWDGTACRQLPRNGIIGIDRPKETLE
jgi:hypothetical protein